MTSHHDNLNYRRARDGISRKSYGKIFHKSPEKTENTDKNFSLRTRLTLQNSMELYQRALSLPARSHSQALRDNKGQKNIRFLPSSGGVCGTRGSRREAEEAFRECDQISQGTVAFFRL